MEKDIGKIPKNNESEIVIRIDDFGGNRGLTIREFVTSEKYTGFTKAGVRIKSEDFVKFKEMINSINEDEMNAPAEESQKTLSTPKKKSSNSEEMPDY